MRNHHKHGTRSDGSKAIWVKSTYIIMKADIWSAGIILLQMISGDFPFQAKDKKTMLN